MSPYTSADAASATAAAATASGEVPLNRAFTLAAHNAYASDANGYWLSDQTLDVEGLVAAGAHWLSIDTYWDQSTSTVRLQHNTVAVNRLIRGCGEPPLLLEDFLMRIAAMLAADLSLILVIDIEEYVAAGGAQEAALRTLYANTVGKYVLESPSDGSTRAEWPTLAAMRGAGTRLVLLNQRLAGGVFHAYFESTWSTTYGTLCLPRQLEQLDTNTAPLPGPAQFTIVPHFPAVPLLRDWPVLNTRKLDDMLAAFVQRYPGVTPSAVSLDHVGRGSPGAAVRKHFPGLAWY